MRASSSSLAALVVLAGIAAYAATSAPQAADIRAVPRYGDSSFMFMNKAETRDAANLVTFGLQRATPTFTCMFWCCCETFGEIDLLFVQTMVSTEPALYVSEGGDYSPDLLGDAYWPVERGGRGGTLPLSSTGTWATNCLPAVYDCPASLEDKWQYGCYTINIITDSDLTVTVGGSERNIAASNDMQQLAFQCVAADRSITVASADPDADIYLCVGESNLRQFHSVQAFVPTGDHITFADYADSGISNAWRMVVLRGVIENGGNAIRQNILTFDMDSQTAIEDREETDALWKPRADGCFARHSRIGFMLASAIDCGNGATGRRRCVWGAKAYMEWLDYDLILAIRDKDRDEMQRRGFSTHYNFPGVN